MTVLSRGRDLLPRQLLMMVSHSRRFHCHTFRDPDRDPDSPSPTVTPQGPESDLRVEVATPIDPSVTHHQSLHVSTPGVSPRVPDPSTPGSLSSGPLSGVSSRTVLEGRGRTGVSVMGDGQRQIRGNHKVFQTFTGVESARFPNT